VRWLEAEGDAPAGARDLLAVAAPTPQFTDELRYRLAVGVAKTATPMPLLVICCVPIQIS
jgi:hypothetical protein